MAYSYYCKHCGANHQGDKASVKQFRAEHRPRIEVPDLRALGGKKFIKLSCTLVRTKQGTMARPKLVRYLNDKAKPWVSKIR